MIKELHLNNWKRTDRPGIDVHSWFTVSQHDRECYV